MRPRPLHQDARPAGTPAAEHGFSLIELLVVVSFIAILASIAIPKFPMVRAIAVDGAVKSDLQNAMKAEEAHYANAGEYVEFEVADGGSVEEINFDASKGVSLTATLDGTGIMIVGGHGSSPRTWCISSESAAVTEGAAC